MEFLAPKYWQKVQRRAAFQAFHNAQRTESSSMMIRADVEALSTKLFMCSWSGAVNLELVHAISMSLLASINMRSFTRDKLVSDKVRKRLSHCAALQYRRLRTLLLVMSDSFPTTRTCGENPLCMWSGNGRTQETQEQQASQSTKPSNNHQLNEPQHSSARLHSLTFLPGTSWTRRAADRGCNS